MRAACKIVFATGVTIGTTVVTTEKRVAGDDTPIKAPGGMIMTEARIADSQAAANAAAPAAGVGLGESPVIPAMNVALLNVKSTVPENGGARVSFVVTL